MDDARRSSLRSALESFVSTPLDTLLAGRATDPAARAMALFHDVAREVPAYSAFLAEHGVDPAGVRTREDFERLPLLTKDGYLRRHPLPALCRRGELFTSDTIAVSSGSTGEPTFWPRSIADELSIATRFEQVFLDSFEGDVKRTLAVVRFPLGRPLLDSASLYGTADAGVLGNETPVSIAIRRFLASRPDEAHGIFGESRLPTLVQFDPCSRYFEEHEGTLLFTGDNGVPLVRYHISDRGGVVPYEAMMAQMHAIGCDPIDLAKRAGARTVREQPFVYVFGRSHFAVSYFGANVFPEMVSVGLEQPALVAHVTGKFVMQIVPDEDQNLALAIAVELAPGASGDLSLADAIAGSILAQLLRLDPEFAAYVPKERQRPRVTLHPAGDPSYFPVGVKHRYSRS